MIPNKPYKTAADLMVIALSPALIMVLVGSLCFFLIEVFYRGQMQWSVRWVMLWFVIAIVLVSRIAIEKSSESAALYGLALAAAVWIYLVRTHPSFVLGIALLAVVWFCAHKLVWDCTLIDEDEDSSGQGLLQSRTPAKVESKSKLERKSKAKRKRVAPSSPGLWVVYFSLAALPLFGIGQALLPADAAGSRRMGLISVVLYMGAALGLLITTSFLGLRRYLRQRYLRMPAVVAWAWLKLGVGVALVILTIALFFPRPGAKQAWMALRYQIDYRLQQASQYAAKSNPHGQGEGRAGNDTGGKQGESKTPGTEANNKPASGPQGTAQSPSAPPPAAAMTGGQEGSIYQFLRKSLMVIAALVAGWWLFRCRYLLLEIARSLVDFFRKLLDFMPARKPVKPREPALPKPKLLPLAEYSNPFYAGQKQMRPPAEIIIYTYDAMQAWAREHGVEPHPEQTAREFCREMATRSPELADSYRQLSFLYAHAAYGLHLPAHCDLDPLKELWRQFTWEQANAPAAR
ncbi:MAG TPA: DUF4129 domain-containing protein [Verrucomicrobiae bacterium]|jgi:hypothetical protein|nr:DUF4129 domain-containing protein [Verrucomicrobiae bacterium]